MTLSELLEMTFKEALDTCIEQQAPLCFHFGPEGSKSVILVAMGDDADELYEFVRGKQSPPNLRN